MNKVHSIWEHAVCPVVSISCTKTCNVLHLVEKIKYPLCIRFHAIKAKEASMIASCLKNPRNAITSLLLLGNWGPFDDSRCPTGMLCRLP